MPGAFSQCACCDWVLPPSFGGLMPMHFLHGGLGSFGVEASGPWTTHALVFCMSSPATLNTFEAFLPCFLVFLDLASSASLFEARPSDGLKSDSSP